MQRQIIGCLGLRTPKKPKKAKKSKNVKFIKKRSAEHLSEEQEGERDFDKERRERQVWRPCCPELLQDWP